MGAITEEDFQSFEHVKRCRNTLTHEMLKFASEGVGFDVQDAFDKMIALMKKIELWWFENLEMAIEPDAYPPDLDLEEVIPGPVWSLQMLIDIALGPEDKAVKYYEHFVKHA